MASTRNLGFQNAPSQSASSQSTAHPNRHSCDQVTTASDTTYYAENACEDATQVSIAANLDNSQAIHTQEGDIASESPGHQSHFTNDEKFELLSAYLDDEVTPEERALVNHWLTSDPEMQETYQKQWQLKLAFRTLLF